MNPPQHRASAGKDGGRAHDHRKHADHAYAEINRQLDMLLSGNDKIVFEPWEDFEYREPLEDFVKSKKSS